MTGSLHGLASAFPASHLRFEAVGNVLGEEGLDPISKAVTAAFKGAGFSAGIIWALGRNLMWQPKISGDQRNLPI